MRLMRVAAAALLCVFSNVYTPDLTAQAKLPVGPIPVDCNRACLEGLVNQYLDALAAKDPKRLPLSADVKYTGAGAGDGRRRRVLENRDRPRQLQPLFRRSRRRAGWLDGDDARARRGAADVGAPARPAWQITEIEKSFFRAGGGGPNNIAAMDKQTQPEAIWLQPIPPAQRASRAR